MLCNMFAKLVAKIFEKSVLKVLPLHKTYNNLFYLKIFYL